MTHERSRQQERARRFAVGGAGKRTRLVYASLDCAAIRRLEQAGAELAVTADGIAVHAPQELFDLRSLLLLAYVSPEKGDDAPLPYADYVRWQEGLDASIQADPASDIYNDRLVFGRPHLPRSERLARDIDDGLRREARAVAEAYGVSSEAIWLAAFQLVLARAADRVPGRLCVAHPGRPIEEMANALGAYGWSGDAPATDLGKPAEEAWQRLGKVLAMAREHDVPPIDHAEQPGWPFAFAFLPADGGPVPDFAAAAEEASQVSLSIWSGPEASRLFLELADAPWPEGFAELLVDRLLASLAATLENPAAPLGRCYRLGETERARVDALAQAPAPADFVPFPDRVREAAEADPATVALVEPGRQVDYATLAAQVDEAAATLARRGFGKGQIVALCMEQPLDAVIALLAIQRSGACTAVLDATIPSARIPQMLDTVGAELCVSDLPSPDGTACVAWKELVANPSGGDGGPPSLSPADPAYILFSSGTTGAAKPVMVTHGALDAYRSGILARLPLEDCRTFLMVSPLAVDLGYTMLISALAGGRTLAIVPPAVARDARALAEFAAETGIDALKITPTHLAALLRSDPRFLPRRLLLTGGEPLGTALVSQLRALGDFQIANHYGPAEATVGVAARLIDHESAGDPPLGPALHHCEARLLDEWLEPVGFYERGELYLGGAQLAAGYAADPAATAASFVPDSAASPGCGARLYRTGDFARSEQDGTLRFAGRSREAAMKRHGRRIDLQEIANELGSLPGIADATATLRPDGEDLRLDAYLVPTRDVATSEADEAALIRDWRAVFDASHGRHEAVANNAFATYGWNSSYDGEPLPIEEISEQIAATVVRLCRYVPRRVLDFGCGTGSIVRGLAPYCEAYLALDPSPVMLEAAEVQWHRMGGDDRVRFLAGGIERLADAGDASFDLIVMNSVVQYFPSLDYLRSVLRELYARLDPAGRIFVGDVRDLGALEAFHASVVRHRFGVGEAPTQLASRVAEAVERELELVLPPGAFDELGQELGLSAEPLLKRGSAQNELNRFRYDVVLHRAARAAEIQQVAATDDYRANFERQLRTTAAAPRMLVNIPNRRVMGELALLASWRAEPDADMLAQAARRAVDPEELHRLAEGAGVELRLMPGQVAGRMDAVIGGDPLQPLARAGSGAGPVATEPLRAVTEERLRQQVREALRRRLPPHQIPDTLTILAELPRGTSGKVDTARLPFPLTGGSRTPKRPPMPGDETAILSVLREMLRSDALGPDDDFFAMGGHSLLAIQALVRLRERCGRAPPLRAFFEGATSAAALARLTERQAGMSAVTGIADDSCAVTKAERRLLSEAEPQHPAFGIGFAVVADGPFDRGAFETALNTIAGRHETWRSSYRKVGGEWRRIAADAVCIPVEWRDLAYFGLDAESAAAREAARFKNSPFDLSQGPLVRALVMRLAPDRHAMVLVVHHVISDGWSTAILARESSDAYRAAKRGIVQELPALDYAGVAAAERALDEAAIEAWRGLLRDIPLGLALPTTHPRPARHDRRGTSIGVALDGATITGAREIGRQEGATLFMVLAAAYGAALARMADVGALTIGTAIATRRSGMQERMLGCFINLLAIPLRVPARATFREFVRTTKRATLAAFDCSDVCFSDVVAALGATQDGSRPPLFQAMFELANMPSGTLELEGLRLSELPFDHGTSEFELNLILRETGNGAAGWLIYRTALFDEAAARGIFARFRAMLVAGIARPDDRLPA